MVNAVGLVPLFPLVGAIINGLAGNRLKKKTASIIGCGSVLLSFLTFLLVFVSFLGLPHNKLAAESYLYKWINSGSFTAYVGFQVDPLSILMMFIITGVGFLIHLYSVGYMHEDAGYSRYFAYLNLFTASMLTLVLANNFLLMFVGWEGVGLCSYLLIGFWYEKKSASDAGKKAFIINRIGDFGFIISTLIIFVYFGTLDFTEVFKLLENPGFNDVSVITAITLLLFLGATGKSAQIPLYTWLPDAMEGPTPVSALIHAATMVTAGIYMIVRCSALYILAPSTMWIIAVMGSLTAFFAATIALTQSDIKKVLAYSTVSQLGYMFLACGVGAFNSAMFHLFTHAYFKACLFLCAGSVIHSMAGEQDIEKMGGLKKFMPTTYKTFAAATLAISGIPIFSGFFSKDEILFNTYLNGGFCLWFIGVITALMTSFYMFRLLFKVFYGELKSEIHAHESPQLMVIPLIILAVFSAGTGLLGLPFPDGYNLLKGFLHPVIMLPEGSHGDHSLNLEILLMAVSTVVALVGAFIAYQAYIKENKKILNPINNFPRIRNLLLNKYFIDEIYDRVFVNTIKNRSIYLWKGVDEGIIDSCVNGLASSFRNLGELIKIAQTGYARHYMLTLIIGMILILTIFV